VSENNKNKQNNHVITLETLPDKASYHGPLEKASWPHWGETGPGLRNSKLNRLHNKAHVYDARPLFLLIDVILNRVIARLFRKTTDNFVRRR